MHASRIPARSLLLALGLAVASLIACGDSGSGSGDPSDTLGGIEDGTRAGGGPTDVNSVADSTADASRGRTSDTSGTTGGDAAETTGGGGDAGRTGGGGNDDAGPALEVPTGEPGTVLALQTEAYGIGCDPDGQEDLLDGATVQEAVVASPGFQLTAGRTGYYVTDPEPQAWSGILVTVPASLGTSWMPGDRFSLTGTLHEAWCNTQLVVEEGGFMALDPATTAPSPLLIDAPADVADWEPWEGSVILLEAVQVLADLGSGRYLTEAGLIVAEDFFPLELEVGATYDISGSLRFAFDQHRLMPHSPAHVVWVPDGPPDTDTVAPAEDVADPGEEDAGPVDDAAGGGPEEDVAGPGDDVVEPPSEKDPSISALQSSTESVGCSVQEPQEFATDLEIVGYVLVGSFGINGALNGYFLTDGSSDPFSAMMMVIPPQLDEDWLQGTRLAVVGTHAEFFCNTQIVADAVVAQPGDPAVPDVLVLSADEVADIEPYEGMLVEVQNATVTSTDGYDMYGEVQLDNGLLVDDLIAGHWMVFDAKPPVGQTYAAIRGIVTWSFGSYRINPVSSDDVVSD